VRACRNACSRSCRAARFLVPRDRSAGLGLHRREAPDRPRDRRRGQCEPAIYARSAGAWNTQACRRPRVDASRRMASASCGRMRRSCEPMRSSSRQPGRAQAHFRPTSWSGPSSAWVGVLLVRDWYAGRGLASLLRRWNRSGRCPVLAHAHQKVARALIAHKSRAIPRCEAAVTRHVGQTMSETPASGAPQLFPSSFRCERGATSPAGRRDRDRARQGPQL